MIDESRTELKDYKIHCFNGEPQIIQIDFDRFVGHKRNLYDTNWKFSDLIFEFPNDKNRHFPKPEKLDKMLEFSKNLSANIPFVRVDFYYISEEEVFFGELTFYPESGCGKFKPSEWNKKFGDWIILPDCNKGAHNA
jgi:hypothetical protein